MPRPSHEHDGPLPGEKGPTTVDAEGDTEDGRWIWEALRAGPEAAAEDGRASQDGEHARAGVELEERVRRIARGLFRRKAPPRTLLGDLVQDAVLSTLECVRRGLEPPTSLEGFLYWRVRHVLGRRFRAALRRETPLEEEQMEALMDAEGLPAGDLEGEEVRSALRACVAELTEARREAWRHRYDEGTVDEDAARALQTTVNAYRVRLCHAAQAVKRCLERKGILVP